MDRAATEYRKISGSTLKRCLLNGAEWYDYSAKYDAGGSELAVTPPVTDAAKLAFEQVCHLGVRVGGA